MIERSVPASERLKKMLGKDLSFEIVSQDEATRVSRWRDADGVIHVCSFVRFERAATDAFPEVHARIVNGSPIGETFKAAGIPFHREELPCRIQPGKDYEQDFGRTIDTVWAVDVKILVGEQNSLYATIRELYSEDPCPKSGI